MIIFRVLKLLQMIKIDKKSEILRRVSKNKLCHCVLNMQKLLVSTHVELCSYKNENYRSTSTHLDHAFEGVSSVETSHL